MTVANSGIESADRMAALPFSGIRRISEAAGRLERQGRDVVHLTIGRPDFDTPAHIKEAAKAALDAGKVHYTSNWGIPQLRQAIATKLRAENGIDLDWETEILVVSGAAQAIAISMLGFLNPGDEVLLPVPAYTSYLHMAAFAGARVVPVPLDEARGFALDPAELRGRITSRTRMLVLVSPGNPTGAIWSQESLTEVAALAAEHGLLVIADEIYEKLVYGGHHHFSIASLPEVRERTITINGFSKAYSMTGWRLGYVAASRPLIDVLVRLVQYTTTCATTFAQWGAVAALTGPQDAVEEMRLEFDRRRNLVERSLSRMPGVVCAPLQGAFYAFPDVSELGLSAAELADRLLEEASVAVVPGSVFGPGGEGHLRISYATDYRRLEEGLGRLADAFDRISSEGGS